MKTLETREWIGVAIAVVAATVLFFGNDIKTSLFGTTAKTSGVQEAVLNESGTSTPANQITATNISTVKGIEIYDLKEGTGLEATAGKKVTTHYIGTFTDNTKFDSSLDRNKPYEFVLGRGEVIKGWDIGIAGMKVGGIRALVISPEYAYGPKAIGSIPANSTLIFQVQLLDVK